ncbi:hypothetical protein AUEXF2481DRAFT_651522 [Aureobasidium subglaciale EXF-2481]|uniref:Uncharacterized protein n=1 Tax=Aureobasidium subglaciale (strain EXF-2481) TaxID=1043005 RepID=A0A074YKY6_AURSE|nr:uncharacterized protein AUEXF2481DRAFT_651522 [Aureobasidium subglaciale EXF-2481]KEQ96699.1 hypothetical protein AUEXF2481DRAFT_651522 [Aureobasidium subglaciale EXF-2481]
MSRYCRRENIAWKSVAWQSRLRIFLMSVAWMTMSSVGCASEVVRFHVLCSDDTAYAGCNTADGVLLSTDDRNISMPGVCRVGCCLGFVAGKCRKCCSGNCWFVAQEILLW